MADPSSPHVEVDVPGLQDWRRLVHAALGGRDFGTLQTRTRDGVLIEPIYAPRTDTRPLPGRGARPWKVVQIVDDADPERANAQALQDIEGGAGVLALRFAGSPAAAGRSLPPTEEALNLVLDGVDIAAVAIRIEPHPLAPLTAKWLRALVARQGVAQELAEINWGLDPLIMADSSAADGDERMSLARSFSELHAAGFRGALAEADTRIIHAAGGSEVQELAAFLAGVVCWLRMLEEAGIAAETALPCFGATLAVDRDQFLSVAKLRAARLLWARLAELCGAPAARLHLHAETSGRMMTRADPHSNLLRTTLAAFAAAAGGADSLTVLPYDAALGTSDRNARALARNIQHLLIEEAHLYRVDDPGAGSGLVEALTEGLAERAWAEFQTIEREGGLLRSLGAGAFPARIAAAREALRTELASGATPLVGATVFRPTGHEAAGDDGDAVEREAVAGLAPVRLEELVQAPA